MVSLVMSSDVRNPEEKTKKAVVLKNVPCLKEWLMSCLPNGPFRSAITLGRVVFQWGVVVDWGGEAGRVDSPSMAWGCEAGGNPGSFK